MYFLSRTLTPLSSLPPSGFPMKHVFLLISPHPIPDCSTSLYILIRHEVKLLKPPSDHTQLPQEQFQQNGNRFDVFIFEYKNFINHFHFFCKWRLFQWKVR